MDKLSEYQFIILDPDNAFAFAYTIFRMCFVGFWQWRIRKKNLKFNMHAFFWEYGQPSGLVKRVCSKDVVR